MKKLLLLLFILFLFVGQFSGSAALKFSEATDWITKKWKYIKHQTKASADGDSKAYAEILQATIKDSDVDKAWKEIIDTQVLGGDVDAAANKLRNVMVSVINKNHHSDIKGLEKNLEEFIQTIAALRTIKFADVGDPQLIDEVIDGVLIAMKNGVEYRDARNFISSILNTQKPHTAKNQARLVADWGKIASKMDDDKLKGQFIAWSYELAKKYSNTAVSNKGFYKWFGTITELKLTKIVDDGIPGSKIKSLNKRDLKNKEGIDLVVTKGGKDAAVEFKARKLDVYPELLLENETEAIYNQLKKHSGRLGDSSEPNEDLFKKIVFVYSGNPPKEFKLLDKVNEKIELQYGPEFKLKEDQIIFLKVRDANSPLKELEKLGTGQAGDQYQRVKDELKAAISNALQR